MTVGTRDGPPQIVAIIGISPDADVKQMRQRMLDYCHENSGVLLPSDRPHLWTVQARVDGNKQHKYTFVEVPRESMAVLDATKVADTVVLVTTPSPDNDTVYTDEVSHEILSLIQAQGVPTVVGTLQGIDRVPRKHQSTVSKSCTKFFEAEFSQGPKCVSVTDNSSLSQLFRWINHTKRLDIAWRDSRNYVLAERAIFKQTNEAKTAVKITGYLRGGLSINANQLVHVTGFGDYQLSQIDGIMPLSLHSRRSDDSEMNTTDGKTQHEQSYVLHRANLEEREPLQGLRPIDALASNEHDQSIITEEELLAAEAAAKKNKQRETGMVDYDKTWTDALGLEHQGTGAASASHGADVDAEMGASMRGHARMVGGDVPDDDQMSLFNDGDDDGLALPSGVNMEEDPAEARRKREQEDMNFPDEVDVPLDQPARLRFTKYRGLKSFQQSPWDPYENLPIEYSQITHFEDMNATRKALMREYAVQPSTSVMPSGTQTPRLVDTAMGSTISAPDDSKDGASMMMDDAESSSGFSKAKSAQVKQSLDTVQIADAKEKQAGISIGLAMGGGAGVSSATTRILPGRRIVLYLDNVPMAEAQAMCATSTPLLVWGLLPFEHRVSVAHYTTRRHHDDEDEPIRCKDRMLICCGFRRFFGKPVYSDSNKARKHMISRFFTKDQHAVATTYARVMFGKNIPVLMFRANRVGASSGSENHSEVALTVANDGFAVPAAPGAADRRFNGMPPVVRLSASGTLAGFDPTRMNIKRIVLTGYPISCNKRRAVIRYMFHNADDIMWFKVVELVTKDGLVGHIREPRGTKGYMKCQFDRFIKSSDIVCMRLYKRQFPKWEPELIEQL
jgi:pre-rRNA-processing protein TSR1